MNVVEIPLKHLEDVDKLIECERKGEIYKCEIDVQESTLAQITTLEQTIKDLDRQVKEAKEQQDKLKSMLMEEMKKRKLTTFENDGIKITLVQPSKTVKETIIDNEALNKEIVSEYEEAKKKYDAEVLAHTTVNETKIKQQEYLRITFNKEKKDE